MPITHAFVSQKPDGEDTSVVRPSDWNAAHVIDGLYTSLVVSFSDTITLTNSPANVREILNVTSYRLKLDLSSFTQFRVVLNVQTAGAAGADVHFEGSADGTNWYDLDNNGGPEIAINPAGAKDTGWQTLYATLRADNVLVRMMEKDGNGSTDPILRQVLVMFK
jgi:hypothetical protein